MATAEPKYTAAAFRKLLAKFAAAKAEASAKIEAQIKEIVELVSPGFGNRFIDLFRKQWSSPEDAREYVYRRNLILVWFDDFAADKRRRTLKQSTGGRSAFLDNRNRRMAEEFDRKKKLSPGGPSDTELMANIGKNQDPPLKRTASIEAVKRGLKDIKYRKA